MFIIGFDSKEYHKTEWKGESVTQTNMEKLEREKARYQKALERLDDLYLFDEAGLSKKDYLTKNMKSWAN